MKSEIRERIEQINKGQVPQGYKKTKMGIIPYIWEIKSIKDIANVSSGATPNRSKDNYWNGDIPWVTTGELFQQVIISTKEHISKEAFNNTNLKLYPKNTLIIAMYGQGKTRGTIAILKIPSTINQACCAINVHDDYFYKFLFYQLQYSYHHIRTLSNTGNQENLNANIIKNYNVIIPPLLEQEKITKILSTQNIVIELKKKLIQEKQKQKKYLMQNLLTGKMRLKGFIGEWKKIELGEIFDYVQPTPYIVKSAIYDDNYKTPVLTAGKSFILGYTNENFGIYLDVPTVIFDDFTTSSQFVNFPFKVKSSAIKILKCKKNYDIVFCFAMLQSVRYVVGGHERHWISKFSNIVVKIPKIEEQKAIAKILSTQDKEIELLQKELEQEKQKKKALMQLLLTGIVRV